MTNSAGNCGFGHIYWIKPYWKTSFFVQCKIKNMNAWKSQKINSVNILLQFSRREPLKEWKLLDWFLFAHGLISEWKAFQVIEKKNDGKGRGALKETWVTVCELRFPAYIFCTKRRFIKVVYVTIPNNVKGT